MDSTRQFFTGAACKMSGGKWIGGHDISGHVFLLVLGSAFLWMEVLYVVLRASGSKEERHVLNNGAEVKNASSEQQPDEIGQTMNTDGNWSLGVKVVMGVAGLSWWMLLMTAAYFHTWFEKLTGLVVAFAGIFIVYFLPRAVPALRAVVGLPGL